MIETNLFIPSNFQTVCNRLFDKLNNTTTEDEKRSTYSQILQFLAESTKLTSTYLCQWNPHSSCSTVIAEFYTPDANYFERISDLNKPYYEDPHSVVGGWITNNQTSGKQINFYNLPPTDPDRITYLKYGARSIFFSRILLDGETWGYIELWESRYNHTFNLEQQAIYFYVALQFELYLSSQL